MKTGYPLASLCQEGNKHPADKQHIFLYMPSLVSFASVISFQGIGLKKLRIFTHLDQDGRTSQ